MKRMKPPALARWLLQQFAVNDSVIGDLTEQYYNGRSLTWYLRQVVLAIWFAVGEDIRAHKTIAIRAVVVGCAAQWFLLFLLRDPVRGLTNLVGKTVNNWTLENGFDGLAAVWAGDPGRFGLPVLLTVCVASAATGWIVGRLHQSRGTFVIAAFAASTPFLVAVWLYRKSAFVRQAILSHRAGYSTLVFDVSYLLIAIPLCALLGGLCARPLQDHQQFAD